MIKVFIWLPVDDATPSEHASLQVNGEHISWFPSMQADRELATEVHQTQLLSNELSSIAPGLNETQSSDNGSGDVLDQPLDVQADLQAAVHAPAWQAVSLSVSLEEDECVMQRPAERCLRLEGLEEARVLTWWHRDGLSGEYSSLGLNCISTVGKLLRVGGAEDYCVGFVENAGYAQHGSPASGPACARGLARYVSDLRHGLDQQRDWRSAVHFVRRYGIGPAEFRIATATLQREAFVEALFVELSKDSQLVYQALRLLQIYGKEDLGYIAKQLVYIVRRRQGLPRLALANHGHLSCFLGGFLRSSFDRNDELGREFLFSLNRRY